MKTILYIDGFNFYYGMRRFGIRWVDPRAIAKALLPGHDILRIRYFSALIKPDPMDPDKSTRQHTYLRALRTLPELDIQLGAFLQSVKKMPLFPLGTPPVKVDVLKTEEKGSDVNLAVALLLDAFDDAMECAVVLSNDSDLLEPIRIVRRRFRKTVGLINPQKRLSYALQPEVDFYKQIRRGVLEASQFPDSLTDSQGTFHKPPTW
ncbi:MAG: NYN domain-containing protein [Chthoniobacterales bacterium]|nr:NYN domain-containing protein [Chthoniobacterales bacterium]